jgi:hypothetical protein
MLARLEGRLTWERAGNSIRVAIPVRRGRLMLFYGPLVIIWLIIASIRYWHVLSSPHAQDPEFTLQMIAIGIYVVGFLYFLWWITWSFTGETMVILNPIELKIQQRIIGIDISTKTFRNEEVARVIYVPPAKSPTNQSVIDPTSGKITFRAKNTTHAFAKGILEIEASVLIEQMLQIYGFPGSYFT